MKQLSIYIAALALLLAGCKKEVENIFDKTPDERITEVLNNFQSALVQDPGWKLFVYPQGLKNQDVEVGGLTYYVKFTNDNRVSMLSDFIIDMAATPKESGYTLKAIQRPSIVFDTYSYIHVAADPDPDVSSSPAPEAGFGWGTDFDFAFVETTAGDTIRLKGNYNNSDALLIKATSEEMNAAFNGRLAQIMDATSEYNTNNPLLYFNGTDNARISISFNLYLYIINFTFAGAGSELASIAAPFSHTTYGLHFKNPVTVGGYTFQDLYWDDALEIYYIQAGGQRVDIANSSVPIFPMYKVLGKSITTIRVPVDPLPGQSALYTNTYNTVKNSLLSSPYVLNLETMRFIFDDASKTMALVADVFQPSSNTRFPAQYVYSYTMDNSGIAKFTSAGANSIGSQLQAYFTPLLDYLASDRFLMDYYTGSLPVLGQFTSQETPAFYFTGELQ